MRCSARGEGAAVAAVAAAGPPLSADAGASAPSRPLGTLSAHAASVAAQPPPTTPFCAGALVGVRTSARSGAFFTFPLTADGGASPKAAVSPPPPSTSATGPAQHRPFRALPVGARSTEGAGAASPDGCLGGADGGPLLRSRARSGRRSALNSLCAAACEPHLAALPLVGAPTAQPPGATGAVAPRACAHRKSSRRRGRDRRRRFSVGACHHRPRRRRVCYGRPARG